MDHVRFLIIAAAISWLLNSMMFDSGVAADSKNLPQDIPEKGVPVVPCVERGDIGRSGEDRRYTPRSGKWVK